MTGEGTPKTPLKETRHAENSKFESTADVRGLCSSCASAAPLRGTARITVPALNLGISARMTVRRAAGAGRRALVTAGLMPARARHGRPPGAAPAPLLPPGPAVPCPRVTGGGRRPAARSPACLVETSHGGTPRGGGWGERCGDRPPSPPPEAGGGAQRPSR